jgi:hypothetical protein
MATTHIPAPSQSAIEAANAAAESALKTMAAAAKAFENDPSTLTAFLAATDEYELASKRAQAMRDAGALDIESSDCDSDNSSDVSPVDMQTFTGIDGVKIRADLARASALVIYSTDDGETWAATPFQTADAGHDKDRLIKLVDEWLDGEAS